MAEGLSDRLQISFDASKIVCRHYAVGFCRHGFFCFLPHVGITHRKRDNVCRYFLNRNCSFGPQCTFDHVHFRTENGKTMLHLDPPQIKERIAVMKRKRAVMQREATSKVEITTEEEFCETLKNMKDGNIEKENTKQIPSNYIAANYDAMFPPLSCGSENPKGMEAPGQLRSSPQLKNSPLLKTPGQLKNFQHPSMYPSPVEYPNFEYIQNRFPCNPIDLTRDDLFNIFKYRIEVLQEEKSRDSEFTDDGVQESSETDSLSDFTEYVTTSEEVSENEDICDCNVTEDEDWKNLGTEKEANRSGISNATSMETPTEWYDHACNYFKQKMVAEKSATVEQKRLE